MIVPDNFHDIVGNNEKLIAVFKLMQAVAPTDSLVLILGESGTGKERIAECIHQLSMRTNKPFIKVNCAALPLELVESALFGHERGAFTGAAERKIGKFELANNGTIFLDEIGTLSLESQAKLLRVLQENEIERVGGHMTIKLNVRIIAATNSDLELEVKRGNFRSDLYYRLKVLPITLPPLRERKDDIPLLVQYFLNDYCCRMKRPEMEVCQRAMARLLTYNWPGNIRELKHVIERAIVLGEQPCVGEESFNAMDTAHTFKTIDEVERDHIMIVLTCCKGKIGGEDGAAKALRIAPTTLQSKIKRLGINRIPVSPMIF